MAIATQGQVIPATRKAGEHVAEQSEVISIQFRKLVIL
jgi:hypothetical protein